MLITITKEVEVEVTSDEIAKRRKSGGSFANEGIMRDEINVAYVIANNKALELILKQDKNSVKTRTSIDSEVSFNI